VVCNLKRGLDHETLTESPAGSKPTTALLSAPRAQFFYLAQLPPLFSHLPFVIVAPLKIIHQLIAILITILFTIPNTPEFIIAQVRVSHSHTDQGSLTAQKNPPSIPTLVVMWFLSYVTSTKVIIDWHNLGYTILALKLGETHPAVTMAKL
jgi:beta-1,4-mannosyltransferase